VTGPGSTTETTPWSFAPSPIAAGGDCARLTASVTPTNDRLQVRKTIHTQSFRSVDGKLRVLATGSVDTSHSAAPYSRRVAGKAFLQLALRPSVDAQGCLLHRHVDPELYAWQCMPFEHVTHTKTMTAFPIDPRQTTRKSCQWQHLEVHSRAQVCYNGWFDKARHTCMVCLLSCRWLAQLTP
jgi:hypothetical protein